MRLGMMRCALVTALFLTGAAAAGEVARFQVTEPLGMNWSGEWLTRDLEAASATPDRLHLLGHDGKSVPAQLRIEQGKLRVLFLASIQARQSAVFIVTDAAPAERAWRPLAIDGRKVSNGLYALDFSARSPMPRIDGLDTAASWPAGVEVTDVKDEWVERGPARAILRRTFAFKGPAQRYEITFDMRAEDPWIGITDRYALGKGSFIRWDLAGLKADKVYHPYAYNARTFLPGGPAEDSTLQPPQHPIATLGPIWRDIWYNGGPLAFVYYSAGERHWAIVPGHPDLRKRMGGMIRSHADIPLDRVLNEWVLDWPTTAPAPKTPVNSFGYLGGPFNEHSKNPTSTPRGVKRMLFELLKPRVARPWTELPFAPTPRDARPGRPVNCKMGAFGAASCCEARIFITHSRYREGESP